MRSTHDTISSASMLYVNSDINTAVVGKNRRVSMASGYDLARAESGRFVGHDTTTTRATTTTPGSNEEREDGDEGERRRMKKQRGFIMRGLSSEEGSHSEQTIEREHGFDAFGAQGGHSAIPIVSPWRDSPQKIAEWKKEAEQSGDSWIGHYSAEFNNGESTIDSSEFDHGIDDGWAAAGYGGMGQPQHEGQAAPSAEDEQPSSSKLVLPFQTLKLSQETIGSRTAARCRPRRGVAILKSTKRTVLSKKHGVVKVSTYWVTLQVLYISFSFDNMTKYFTIYNAKNKL